MLMAMLLSAAAPDQRVVQRIDASLPPVSAETRGLISDRPRLEVDLAALFDDDDDSALRRQEQGRADEVVARVIPEPADVRRGMQAGAMQGAAAD